MVFSGKCGNSKSLLLLVAVYIFWGYLRKLSYVLACLPGYGTSSRLNLNGKTQDYSFVMNFFFKLITQAGKFKVRGRKGSVVWENAQNRQTVSTQVVVVFCFFVCLKSQQEDTCASEEQVWSTRCRCGARESCQDNEGGK